MRLLGLDPGLARTGWGLIIAEGARLSHAGHGVLVTPPALPVEARLASLAQGLSAIIAAERPAAVAIEEIFLNANARSSLALAQARGALLAAVGMAGLPVTELAARFVKKAIVGTGAAEKGQVAAMVMRLLPAAGPVSADAADALAVAIAAAAVRRNLRAA